MSHVTTSNDADLLFSKKVGQAGQGMTGEEQDLGPVPSTRPLLGNFMYLGSLSAA